MKYFSGTEVRPYRNPGSHRRVAGDLRLGYGPVVKEDHEEVE